MNANNPNTKLNPKYLVWVGLCSSMLALSACQPSEEHQAQEPNATESQTDTHSAQDHHFQETHDMTTLSSPSEFEQAYMQGMNTMHNDMMAGIQANDADVAFAKGMLPHHRGAVDMAKVQLKYGKDNIMRKLAEDIIAAQQDEIEQMQNWLDTHPDTAEQDYTQAMQKSYEESMQDMHNEMMHGMHSNDPDMAFAKGMLSHHKGAIAMAKVQLKYGKDKEMRQLAEDIIAAQQSEVKLMEDWIAEHS